MAKPQILDLKAVLRKRLSGQQAPMFGVEYAPNTAAKSLEVEIQSRNKIAYQIAACIYPEKGAPNRRKHLCSKRRLTR